MPDRLDGARTDAGAVRDALQVVAAADVRLELLLQLALRPRQVH
jgi:hypothetical protein